jgi:hypothetical protein
MKSQTVRLGLLTAALALVASCSGTETRTPQQSNTATTQTQSRKQEHSSGVASSHQPESGTQAGHSHGASQGGSAGDVPAFQTDAASLKSLPPTLSAQAFAGKQRLAYQVASEIPQTLAQLPCYCYCDRGFGHKSLHSCFVDDHAAHCAVCVDEALLAYRLQKEEKLSPAQIRERIVTQYAPKL